VNKRLEDIMVRSFEEVLTQAEQFKTDLRTGAYILAVNRVADSTVQRGIYP